MVLLTFCRPIALGNILGYKDMVFWLGRFSGFVVNHVISINERKSNYMGASLRPLKENQVVGTRDVDDLGALRLCRGQTKKTRSLEANIITYLAK
jgi:hypothetical protein